MNMFRKVQNKIYLRIITFIVITTFLCQSAAWANHNFRDQLDNENRVEPVWAKLAAKSIFERRAGEYLEKQGDSKLDATDVMALAAILKGLNEVSGAKEWVIDNKIHTLNDAVSYSKLSISQRGDVYKIELPDGETIETVVVNINGVPWRKVYFVDEELTEEQLNELGVKTPRDREWLKIEGMDKVWISNANELDITLPMEKRCARLPNEIENGRITEFGFLSSECIIEYFEYPSKFVGAFGKLSSKSRKMAYIGDYNWGNTVLLPAGCSIDIFTDKANTCQILMSYLADEDGKPYILLSHILSADADEDEVITKQIDNIKRCLEERRLSIKETIIVLDEFRCKSLRPDLEEKLGKKLHIIKKQVTASALVTDQGWAVCFRNSPYIAKTWKYKVKKKIPRDHEEKLIVPFVSTFDIDFGDGSEIMSVTFNPNASTVLVEYKNDIVKLYSITTGREIQTFRINNRVVLDPSAISPDNKYIATSECKGKIIIWETSTWKQYKIIDKYDEVHSLAFTPCGTKLAVSHYGNITLLDIDSGHEIGTIEGLDYTPSTIAVSPDGTKLLTGDTEGMLRLWDIETMQSEKSFKKYPNPILLAAFNNDSTRILIRLWNKTAEVLDAETGEVLHRLYNNGHYISGAAFKEDGGIYLADDRAVVRLYPASMFSDKGASGFAHRFRRDIREVLKRKLEEGGYGRKEADEIILGGFSYAERGRIIFRGKDDIEKDKLFSIAADSLNEVLERSGNNLITADCVKAILEYHEAIHIQLRPDTVRRVYDVLKRKKGVERTEINRWWSYFERQYGKYRVKENRKIIIMEEIIAHMYMERMLGNKHLILLNENDQPVPLPRIIEGEIERICGALIMRIDFDSLQYGNVLRKEYLKTGDVAARRGAPPKGKDIGRTLSLRDTAAISGDLNMRINIAMAKLRTGDAQEGVRELVEIGRPSVAPLTAAFHDEDPKERELAYTALVGIGQPAVGPLTATLRDKTPHVRKLAYRALVSIGGPSVGSLTSMLRDEDPEIRELAYKALVEIGEPSVKSLVGVLHDEDPKIRKVAHKILVEIGEPSVGPLTAMFHDEDPKVRELPCRTLAEIGESSVRSLIGVLHDEDPEVRELGRRTLMMIGEPSVKPLTGVLRSKKEETRKITCRILVELDKLSVYSVSLVLRDEDPELRGLAKGILVRIGKTAVSRLMIMVHDERPETVKIACTALVEIGRPSVGPLTAMLRDEDPEMRELARKTLVRLGRLAVSSLTAALKDELPEKRELAYRALVEIGGPSVGPLTGALHDPKKYVRELACRALAEIGEPSVQPLIRVLYDEDPDVRVLACWALVKIGKPSVKPLINILCGENEIVSDLAWKCLVFIGEPAVAMLTDAYHADESSKKGVRLGGILEEIRGMAERSVETSV